MWRRVLGPQVCRATGLCLSRVKQRIPGTRGNIKSLQVDCVPICMTKFKTQSLVLQNREQMLFHDFRLLLSRFINQCDQSIGVLSLVILFGVK